MARNIDAKCRLCRRANEKLFLKGERCFSQKCAMVRRAYPPGIHGSSGSRNVSEYGRQLAMKQRIKRIYGVLERQFRKHFEEVSRKQGVLGDLLMERLESRLDSVIYRMGFASSRSLARQLVSHGAFSINGRKSNIPSMRVKEGDTIAVRAEKIDKQYFKNIAESFKNKKDFPVWVEMDAKKFQGKIISQPKRSDGDVQVDSQSVVEFYSR